MGFLFVFVFSGLLVSNGYTYCLGMPRDCQDIQSLGFGQTGVYTIYPEGTVGFKVRCDMDTDNGGWTVIQRRISDTDFYKSWNEYQVGFGDNDNHWLGNQQISMITAQGWYELRVDLVHPNTNESRYAVYNVFSLGGWNTAYTLYVNGYSGTAGDSLTTHSGAKFSTKDRDNDVYGAFNCASLYTGAWWYKACHRSNLNGDFGNNAYGKGLNWYDWTGHYLSLKKTEMKIRKWQQ